MRIETFRYVKCVMDGLVWYVLKITILELYSKITKSLAMAHVFTQLRNTKMTTIESEKLKHFIACLQAHVEGKTIEYNFMTRGWKESDGELLYERATSFIPERWRVKPEEPKVKPHIFETAPAIAKGRCKTTNLHGTLFSYPNKVHFVMTGEESTLTTYDEAAELFELLDGSPYGIQEQRESEWPKGYQSSIGSHWYQLEENGPIKFRMAGCVGFNNSICASWNKLIHRIEGGRPLTKTETLAIIEGGAK